MIRQQNIKLKRKKGRSDVGEKGWKKKEEVM